MMIKESRNNLDIASWVEVEIIDLLTTLPNGKKINQGWSPQCKSHASPSEDIWGVLKTTAIQANEFRPFENKELPLDKAIRDHLEVVTGDILLTCAGPRNRCGIACRVRQTRKRLLLSGKMYRFQPDIRLVIGEYLVQYLQSANAESQIDRMKTGGSESGLNLTQSRFKKLKIPLPPLPEQGAIVTKLEALFHELEEGIASLQRAQDQLKIYRQAVLKKAFEGELTRAWREQQTDLPTAEELLAQIQAERERYYQEQLVEWEEAVRVWEAEEKVGKKPKKPRKLKHDIILTSQESERLPNIPNLWKWCRMGSVANRIQIGPFGSQLHRHDYVEKGVPVINPKHIKDQSIKPAIFIDEEKASSLPQYALKSNDIILGRRGEMGRSAFISEYQNGWMCGTGSLFIRLSSIFEAKLYSLVLSERRVVSYLEDKGSGTTMTNLNSEILNNLPIQIISLPEQHQIVQEIESRLSVCDQVEKDIVANLKRAERLRQSILQKAFAGELLTEAELAACRAEPDWEPAAVLLERIKKHKTQK
ncbi:MAG: restriction endonuclease subunit S [Lewinella sp.]|uniref:restriction endonuclease subunit S n=1 Tax=Lewinella sp. TaxID=2004506 RepID=UPI003D6AAA3F